MNKELDKLEIVTTVFVEHSENCPIHQDLKNKCTCNVHQIKDVIITELKHLGLKLIRIKVQ